MLKWRYSRYELRFRQPAVTSRSTMLNKKTYFVEVSDVDDPEWRGVGEVALFEGLSAEDDDLFEQRMVEALRRLSTDSDEVSRLLSPTCEDVHLDSSVAFGVETALANRFYGGKFVTAASPFTQGKENIVINGLIWMGGKEQMIERLKEKIEQGFKCIKVKIGGIDFDDELALLRAVRRAFGPETLELRLDCNGSLSRLPFKEAVKALRRLEKFKIHSVEQPFAVADIEKTRHVCLAEDVPIALDEQLIGVTSQRDKYDMLEYLCPSYIVVKPSLCGGLEQARRWIETAVRFGKGWWVTSALESAVGLNAIAQWTASLNPSIPQGLGTGELYLNDFASPLRRCGQYLSFMPSESEEPWQLDNLNWIDV